MGATSKQRTPSRCREWERERRNKFNQAISTLGELVLTIAKENQDGNQKDVDNTQFPKIEVIQRAISCLKEFKQQKSSHKAEILALQVKLDALSKGKCETKDVSTQICKGAKTKLESKQYNSMLIVKKCKQNATKCMKKSLRHSEPSKQTACISTRKIVPKILPKCSTNRTDNTLVVLPAAPYIIPQRPLLLPTGQPTLVFLNPNMQNLTKPSIPIITRNNSDVTKTTMVNILPISAYSRPLSAIKTKKNNSKIKSDAIRKKLKPIKTADSKTSSLKNENKNVKVSTNCIQSDKVVTAEESILHEEEHQSTDKNQKAKIDSVALADDTVVEKSKNENAIDTSCKNISTKESSEIQTDDLNKCIKNTVDAKTQNEYSVEDNVEKESKSNNVKETQGSEKSKIPNILDTSLCENTVDGGNARLELAEELLAASPTAAFLMSFPLVSGNRADSPAEDAQSVPISKAENINQRRMDLTTPSLTYLEKPNGQDVSSKDKSSNKIQTSAENNMISNAPSKYIDISSNTKPKSSVSSLKTPMDNPFLNLPITSVMPSSCTFTDTSFSHDIDCNLTKSIPNQNATYSNNNFFYKSDAFSNVKNSIYSTSSISSGHEFNSLALYPCAMEKYTSKNKSDYANVEENMMKLGSSRLTYDIDLGWSHKGFDFVNSTTNTTNFPKDNLLTSVSTPYSSTYNPFNADLHVPFLPNTSKKEVVTKSNTTFADSIVSFYSQTSNFWPDEMPLYTGNSVSTSKSLASKTQSYIPLDHTQNIKQSAIKQSNAKQVVENVQKLSTNNYQALSDKFVKKSPSKMHINWMTSETKPAQNMWSNDVKDNRINQVMSTNSKKQDNPDLSAQYFPLPVHNYTSHTNQEDFQMWQPSRLLGTAEVSIDTPPLNLPTLIGDLALGPHDKKKNMELSNRGILQTDAQNCSNFLSVTQLMNRSSDNMTSRFHDAAEQVIKSTSKNIPSYPTEVNRKAPSQRMDVVSSQPCYTFNEMKPQQLYEHTNQYAGLKMKPKADKNAKLHKNSYSAESLIRGGSCSQKQADDKLTISSQKYNEVAPQHDNSVAHVSHFPPIIDYTDNTYASQQYPGANLYNSTNNTMSNTFYSNLMPSGANLMTSNYAGAPFSSEFIDYNQHTDCNYSNQKYEEFKMKGTPAMYHADKAVVNNKSSRREYSAKHKLECSKKDSNKKYQNKKAKITTEVDTWNDSANILWQNKTPTKRHSNMIHDEFTFPNYMGNQMSSTQYQTDIFNSHLMPSNVQNMGSNIDRSLASFPVTSRANFNLSTIFPEITMKVQ